MRDVAPHGPDALAELSTFATRANLSFDTVLAGRDLGMDGNMTPEHAQVTLARLPLPSRQMLARAVAIYLVLEEIPPLSLAPSFAPHAAPLVAAGLVTPAAAHDQRLFNSPSWGVVPDGLLGVATTLRLIGLVTALIAGAPQDGFDLYNRALDDFGRFRQFAR